MPKPQIYIDGQSGTTGLRIRDMLDSRDDLELLLIREEVRKAPDVRAEYLNRADLAILCLPDEAAAEALKLVENPQTRIIDTSTAHRVHPDWVYGLPEVDADQREAIRNARRVANPGCYPVGVILAVRPLIQSGLLDSATPLTINAVSGYSGGGRKMIERHHQAPPAEQQGDAAIPLRLYSLGKVHKHLAEMQQFSLTRTAPLFVPSVDHTLCGMLVSVPIPSTYLNCSPEDFRQAWRDHYAGMPFVKIVEGDDGDPIWADGTFLDTQACNFTNRVELAAFGDQEQGVVLVSRLDNLGKGASGNAVQCLNLMLDLGETTGLIA